MEVEVWSSQFPYDMSSWLVEKSQHVLQELTLLRDALLERNELLKNLMNDLDIYFYPIFWDCTKILSFASGGEWSTKDRELILKNGENGLGKLLIKYGLSHKTSDDILLSERRKQIKAFTEKFKELISKPRYPARTQIHELLLRVGVDNTIVEKISDLTEKVTMGELTWDEYKVLAEDLIVKLEDESLP